MAKRLILIDAQSAIYSVKEVVPEDKAVKRLECIKECFKYMSEKPGIPSATLKVKTGIYNPELLLK